MRIPRRHSSDNALDQMSMTPMIDIVFLLLIFFVCAASGQLRELLLPTDLAAGSIQTEQPTEQPAPLGKVWLELRQESGRTIARLEGTDYDNLDRLGATLTALAETAPEIPVILDVEALVPFGRVVRVYDTCRAAGFDTVNFAAEADNVQ